jgi:diguanylate cyclase (GGDEF)-like protein
MQGGSPTPSQPAGRSMPSNSSSIDISANGVPAADRLLADITEVLLSEESPERVLEAVADAVAQLVPYDTLTIYRAETARRLLHPVLVRDKYAEEILALGPLEFGTGITGSVAERRVPELVLNVMADPRAQQIEGTPVEQEALIVVPLLARQELKGTLNVYRVGEGSRFEPYELELAIRFGRLAALTIDNAETRARLENEVITDPLTGLYNHRHFYERLGEEMRRVHRAHLPLGLLVIDIDDFKRANDRFGHLAGDRILQEVAGIFRQSCRGEDVVCRTGGEEFAVIVPLTGLDAVVKLAERIRLAVATAVFPDVESMTVSIGAAAARLHGSSPRELFECADAALRRAKALGKNRVEVYSSARGGLEATAGAEPEVAEPAGVASQLRRLPEADRTGETGRALDKLKVVHALATRLNRLNDVREIGAAITAELRSLIDYHNCRVYLLSSDGDTLVPMAFQGDASGYGVGTVEALTVKVGEGITGRVVESGEPLYVPNALDCDFAVRIPGTSDIDESIVAVPLRYGSPVIGAIVLSKLGIDQFDEGDLLALESLASHAAIAMENARLYQAQKESAEIAEALLRLSERLTRASEVDQVLGDALEAIPELIPCTAAEAWMQSEGDDSYRLAAHRGYPDSAAARFDGMRVPALVAEPFIGSTQDSFVIPKEALALGPPEFRRWEGDLDVLGTPMRWEPKGLGGLAIVAPSTDYQFTQRDVRLARGIADITSLAMANASRFRELEQVYVSTIESLAGALEAQDQYTSDHAHALAEMAVAVGSAMGLAGGALRELELTALFHDIGKIGVPREIIMKPGPLTAEELRIVNQHPEIGEQILSPVPFLKPIRRLVRACHERWDGRGYPEGLAGEEIPLASRIVFVCDAYHAMTTNRPYRQSLGDSEALRRLKLGAGTQFDPAIVDTFVELREQGVIH